MNLNHVTLIVSDFQRSKAFYSALGLQCIVDAPPRYARFQCPEGSATLSIEVTGDPPAPSRTQVYLETSQLDTVVKSLQNAGFAFDQLPTDMPYLWREAWLRDPDGHTLRLYYAGTNRLDPPWKVVQS